MSKLLQLKKWLTLSEAADYLSGALQERVSVVDVLRLGVDGHLVVSVHFVNHATANVGRAVPLADARITCFPKLDRALVGLKEKLVGFPHESDSETQATWIVNQGMNLDDFIFMVVGDRVSVDEVVNWDRAVTSIEGTWDIPAFGGAHLHLEQALQDQIGGPEVTLVCIDGSFVKHPTENRYARLLKHYSDNEYCKDGHDRTKYPYGDPDSYWPPDRLPEDAALVVRPQELLRFLQSLEDPAKSSQKSISTRERASLLRLIKALCVIAKIPERGASVPVLAQLQILGFESPGEATVRNAIKEAWAQEAD